MRPLLAFLIVSLLAISACRPGTAEWRAAQGTQSFVNQLDGRQVIELHPDALTQLSTRIGVEWFVAKRGERGRYTYGSQGELIRGVYIKQAGLMNFRPDQDQAKEWSVKVEQDGSLRDPNGAVWRSRP
jgi:hypothetical protein